VWAFLRLERALAALNAHTGALRVGMQFMLRRHERYEVPST
jgi:hypothetical protein